MNPSAESVETTTVTGFDPEGEPEVQRLSDGSLRVIFNFMPPSYMEETVDDLGPFATFDKDLERALGVPVKWDDREVFLIPQPKADTAAKLKAFLEGYPRPQ